jgi:hypothetical protein
VSSLLSALAWLAKLSGGGVQTCGGIHLMQLRHVLSGEVGAALPLEPGEFRPEEPLLPCAYINHMPTLTRVTKGPPARAHILAHSLDKG